MIQNSEGFFDPARELLLEQIQHFRKKLLLSVAWLEKIGGTIGPLGPPKKVVMFVYVCIILYRTICEAFSFGAISF